MSSQPSHHRKFFLQGRGLSLLFVCCALAFFASSTAWAAKSKKKQDTQISAKYQRYGDISFRFTAGTQVYELSSLSGELLSTTIGERTFSLFLVPEYSYYFGEKWSLFASIPVIIDVDLLVGTTGGFAVNAGLRYHLIQYLYLDLQASLSFVRKGLFRIEFGGLAMSLGFSFPLGSQVRLLIVGQTPFNFIDGFVMSVRTYMGIEAFF